MRFTTEAKYGYDNEGRPIVDYDGEWYYVYDSQLGQNIKVAAKVLAGVAVGTLIGKSLANSFQKGMDNMTQHIRKQQAYYGY